MLLLVKVTPFSSHMGKPSPTEGLGGITVGDLVPGWVKLLAGEQHDTRQSHPEPSLLDAYL